MEYQTFTGLKVQKNTTTKEKNLERLKRDGFFILESALTQDQVTTARQKIDSIWASQEEKWGTEFLRSMGDHGQVRCMMDYDSFFLDLIRLPTVTDYMFDILGPSAILHLQNGIVLHPGKRHNQAVFHRDFPRDFVASKILSMNCLFAIDPFDPQTGGTWLVPGSHLMEDMPSAEYLESKMIQVKANPGDALVFDSLLWHKGGDNLSSAPRRAINQQYTRPFIKQQIDYPAMLKGKVDLESPVAQTLGMWSIPPKNLEEFRVKDRSKRTYRAGQG